MATTDERPAAAEPAPRWGRRLAWLVGLWLVSVLALGTLAWLLGWVLQAVGLQR